MLQDNVVQKVGKSDVSQHSQKKKFYFGANGWFGTTLAKISASFDIMIHSNNLFEMLGSMIGQNR